MASADYLVSRCQASLDCMDRLHSARESLLADNTGEVTHFSFVKQHGYFQIIQLIFDKNDMSKQNTFLNDRSIYWNFFS